ncbi:MAG: ribonuclease H family protein [Bacillota bacterium]|nr:ribonuclease H family protein [Bacillota bacterium]
MAKKVYAVKEGYNSLKGERVSNIILDSWNECESLIKGVKGAKYKSFNSREEAEHYLSVEDPILRKGKDEYPMYIHHAYVDGSYNDISGKYSYGLLIVKEDVISYIENGAAEDSSQKSIRQIGGELKACIRALLYCAENGIKEVVIFHDYEGVAYHATGFWERREESSRQYFEMYNRLVKEHDLKVYFVKVDSHTGDLYNEIVDEFAKVSGGLNLGYETEKLLRHKHVLAASEELKNKFREIIKDEQIMEKIVVVK